MVKSTLDTLPPEPESVELQDKRDTSFDEIVLQTLGEEKGLDAKFGVAIDEIKAMNPQEEGAKMVQNMEALFIAMRTEIDRLVRRGEKLKKAGDLDPLTQVYNRRGFEEEIMGDPDDPFHRGTLEKFREDKASAHQREGEGGWNKEYVIYMLDIDFFKFFNDDYGHAAGDVALKTFAAALAHFVRDDDVVGRWGGEEFVVQMITKDRGDRNAVGTRLLEAIRKIRINIKGRQIPITASIGMAKLKDGEDFKALVERADQGLYKAKQNGRNTISIPEDEE